MLMFVVLTTHQEREETVELKLESVGKDASINPPTFGITPTPTYWLFCHCSNKKYLENILQVDLVKLGGLLV
jgi:hypothetical protein